MAEELKACPLPFCGGPVQFHKDDDCAGCHLIECQSCKTLFDLATKADPYNQSDSIEELQRGIAYLWNLPAQLPSQGGEAVASQVRYRRPEKGTPNWSAWQPAAISYSNPAWCIDSQGYEVEYRLLYTHPADQVADGVVVSRELLERAVKIIEMHWPMSLAMRELRALLAAATQPADQVDGVVVSRELLRFLLGECELQGVSFGDPKPPLGKFWWRLELRSLLAKP